MSVKKIGFLSLFFCFFTGVAFAAAPQGSFPKAANPNQAGASYTVPSVPQPVVVPEEHPVQEEQRVQQQAAAPEKEEYKPWQYEKYQVKTEEIMQREVDDIFARGLTNAIPLSPERTKDVRERAMSVEEARKQEAPSSGSAKFRPLSLKPGATIPTLELFPGNVSVIRFLDSTGAPWPILSYVVGNGDAFSVQRAGGETSAAANVLMITPTKQFADSSLAVTLEPDIPAVVQLRVSNRNSKPEFLVTFRADAEGPKAAVGFVRQEKTEFVDENMFSFLDGVPPKGAQSLKTSSYEVEAWKFNGSYYIKTNAQMMWPSYRKVVKTSGAHNIWVYETATVTSVVVDGGGNPKTVSIEPYPLAAQNLETKMKEMNYGK